VAEDYAEIERIKKNDPRFVVVGTGLSMAMRFAFVILTRESTGFFGIATTDCPMAPAIGLSTVQVEMRTRGGDDSSTGRKEMSPPSAKNMPLAARCCFTFHRFSAMKRQQNRDNVSRSRAIDVGLEICRFTCREPQAAGQLSFQF
jgi:hypothetical protein